LLKEFQIVLEAESQRCRKATDPRLAPRLRATIAQDPQCIVECHDIGVVQPFRTGGAECSDSVGTFLEQPRRDYGLEVRPLRLAGEQLGHVREC
jgi:hypothetical protein